ncbi:carboxymuconolactone decarboxylase family protein [Novosphingobium sp. JCM 18896]|uniref:carboxymuconolactone decarboxylase family protein n=1 Tax=Novosphingobium sp. JCM 18896 TaxID=2989731 RepID=UPI00222292CB|nr:carboxymuconolactone decarboxylase family protein [Novosphingobium sp. JCM 18896]MCW1432296.1 carboxymuconolactone decarboxylase family protein [Novosphingobium sp. JCM 18896]
MIPIAALQALLTDDLEGVPPGEDLCALDEALIELGVRASVTALDPAAVDKAIAAAYSTGATPEQIQEVVTLVSGLGVHSLMVTAPLILEQGLAAGVLDAGPLDAARQEIWRRHVKGSYWQRFDREVPGFLESLLRLSPAAFEGFFAYCALPFITRSLPAVTTELIALATDVTPSHVFPPGARLHISNARRLGAGTRAIARTLAIAATVPEPPCR